MLSVKEVLLGQHSKSLAKGKYIAHCPGLQDDVRSNLHFPKLDQKIIQSKIV